MGEVEGLVHRTIISICMGSILSTMFVALRLWTRYTISHALGLDDLLITLSWVCSVCASKPPV